MQALKTALVAGAIALASTMAYGQASSADDANKTPHNQATDKGAAPPATVAPDDKASMKSPSDKSSTTGAEISDKNKTGSRPGEDTTSPGNMNKTR